MKTEVVGGNTPNQDSAIGGAPNSNQWNRWYVLGGLVLCVIAFFALAAGVFGLFGVTNGN